MQNYIAWGSIQYLNINPSIYVIVCALGEFLATLIFIFLLVSTLLNFKLSKSFANLKKPFGWIVLSISISLIIALLIGSGIEYGIFSYLGIEHKISLNISSLALNPAIIISDIFKGINNYNNINYLPIGNGVLYIIVQLLGAILGALLSYCFFKKLIIYEKHKNKLDTCFYTKPAVQNIKFSYLNEIIATFILVAAIIGLNCVISEEFKYQNILIIGLIVAGIGYGLGGATGYALNPIRDLGPRIAYAICLSKYNNNFKNDWQYVQVPIIGPIIGSLLATIIMPGFFY